MNEHISHTLLSQSDGSRWPETLMAHHAQLAAEIADIYRLMSSPSCLLLPLDARLGKLIRGVTTHLELEAYFLPAQFNQLPDQLDQYELLNQGYQALEDTCQVTSEYMKALKLECGNGVVRQTHIQYIEELLSDIDRRLKNENVIYGLMT